MCGLYLFSVWYAFILECAEGGDICTICDSNAISWMHVQYKCAGHENKVIPLSLLSIL